MIGGGLIRERRQLSSALSVGSAVFVAFVLLLGQRWHSGREALMDQLVVDAAMVGANAGAALTFGDGRAAEEILATLDHTPLVIEAVLYRPDGSRLAGFRRTDATEAALPPRAPAPGREVGWHEIRLATPVTIDRREVGSIALLGHLTPLYEDLVRFCIGLVAIAAVAFALARLASRGLRERMVTAERELERLALFDQVTGLPNRYAFEQTLYQTVARHLRDGKGSALLYLDVDGFKKVNDMFGHHTGDQALREIGARLRRGVRGADIVARLGGDEFAIVLVDTESPDDAARVAGNLIALMAAPIDTGRRPAYVGLSVGIAMIPEDGDSAGELLDHADLAMYHAKNSGRNNSQFFSDRIGSSVRFRLDIEAALRVALAEDQFYLVYQPQVDAVTGKLCGLEALIRWRHPERGVVPPNDFIPVAEESGLILELGQRALALACADIDELRAMGLPPPPVALNVSARQLSRGHLTEEVAKALSRHGLAAADIELELTESVVMDRPEENEPILAELAASGLTVAIDDFGTGYSSLAYLKRLPVSKLKIDRSFVRDLPDHLESKAIVAAIIDLAHALRLRVVAEGTETAAQIECLRGLGCDMFQGFYTGRPMERPALADYLRQQAGTGPAA